MENFKTRIYIERNAVLNRSNDISGLGTKALIVTGKNSSRVNGSMEDVVNALNCNNIPYVIFDEVEENPSIETVYLASSIATDTKCDLFICVGGGSPMDAGKAISLLAKNNIVYKDVSYTIEDNVAVPGKNHLEENLEIAESFLYTLQTVPYYPVICVPTTCGTGSEVTPYSILTSHARKTKKSISHSINPELALVDSKYLKTVPYNVMKNTCADALAHMLESRLCTNANAFSRAYSDEGLKMWGSCKDCLLNEDDFRKMTDNNYDNFMQASVFGGLAIAYTGTSIPHGLSYTLTYHYGVPHGMAVGVFLIGFLANYEDEYLRDYILKTLLNFESLDAFRYYLYTLFGNVKISDEHWKKDVNNLLSNPEKLKYYPYAVSKDMLDSYIEIYNG